MGVGTTCDSLAALEKVVFDDKEATLEEVAEAMRRNFEGYEDLHKKLLAAPKYGNNDPYVDKYAPWFVEYQTGLFDQYRTWDGGRIFTAMAANTANIYAGQGIGATPDGRLAGTPLSDAASPTYGRDVRGLTAAIHSLTTADYSCVACGSVVNQKFSPAAFNDENRPKLVAALKVYFLRGGQEMQINATDAKVLKDAMDHPEKYPNLVVRVSGFSAVYVTLGREVQEDILNRTQKM
jgi:formate C-acetyltransferase